MFLTLRFYFVVGGMEAFTLKHFAVSVSYQPYPSFRPNARGFKAGRTAFKDKRKKSDGAELAKPAL